MNRSPIKSWAGKQYLRTQIQEVARRVRDTDRAVREKYVQSSLATGLICQGIRDTTLVGDQLVAKASQAQRELRDLTALCVQVHNLDWHFVRKEWAPILEKSQ